jgi:protein-L-isoaspartate(D-aspartate) O-methyltransferase
MHPDTPRLIADIVEEARQSARLTGRERLDERVLRAMEEVPREVFVPEALRYRAYDDGPLPIGHGQTISQPFIVALMTDLLETRPTDTVLEVGTGSGYQAAVLSRLVKTVYTLEIIPALARDASERLARLGYDNVRVRCGNGYAGWPEAAPFDGILVAAAAPYVPPSLLEQLKPGGRLVLPVGEAGGTQELVCVEKSMDGGLYRHSVLPVVFVPLVGAANIGD